MEDWEEPHPGQRFQLPSQPGAELRAGELHNPTARDQAEDLGPLRSGHTSRRGFTFRQRLVVTVLKHQRMSTASTDLPRQTQTPVGQTQPALELTRSYSTSALSVTSMQMGPTFDEANSSAKISRSPSYSTDPATSSEPSLPRPWMEWLSSQHHNPVLHGDSSDDQINSGTGADREAAAGQDAALLPCEDPYGWEAELERRLPPSVRSAAEVRRRRNAKRSLLQRVFYSQLTSRHR